ncbi:Os04g0539701 [Oryza sativa Japonica Group]|uniref:Os04g0539701 protein n=1 Tax=Oryza sativa subsp. japonica TaxID=39947 RepID=A0A0P0WCY1_ORYSJ|nr:hypothetical protein EE612_024661 [Oryza sativa]BAS90284.1 Os04g0539701 [Oryza sativa Japonica Group]
MFQNFRISSGSLPTLLLPPFHNVSHFSIFHIHIDVSRFIRINMNVENAKMTYIVKRKEYL